MAYCLEILGSNWRQRSNLDGFGGEQRHWCQDRML